MAQGKFKVKGKVPNQKQKQKGKAFTRRPSEFHKMDREPLAIGRLF